ncbi:MAG: TetR/AcrR family transcriptional regulator [Rhodobacterales bacterium]|nr:TetR/AcrR family transcriptional regulator [Rhodobacterales bacterium]MDX5500163.1 TetR/AcrR family transcriptional regulator [Rhodobacterales bacterium]
MSDARARNRAAKERRILDAAFRVFSLAGYAGASMDAIAEASRVSKPTLYQYFGSKEALFAAMMDSARDVMLEPFADQSGGMVAQLHRFAWAYADVVMRPDLLGLARLVIGEAARFPEIGAAYQTAGPDRLLAGMMTWLERQRAAGRLAFEDAELAAQDLWALILSAPRTQALHRPDDVPNRAQIRRYLENGLRVFLRAYSNDPQADLAALADLAHKPPTTGTT